MVTITCKLTLPDGQVITGTIKNAISSETDYPIEYTGPVERLPDKWDELGAGSLEYEFKRWAEELGGKVTVKSHGCFDVFMQCLDDPKDIARRYRNTEARMRRLARRKGYRVEKSPERDQFNSDYGSYRLIRIADNEKCTGDGSQYGIDLVKVLTRLCNEPDIKPAKE